MKIILLALIFTSSAFSKDPMQTTLEAFSKTKEGKYLSKKIEDKAVSATKQLPKEIINLSALGISQQIKININKNNIINLNYRRRTVFYNFKYNF